ncbi:MAG: ABC transporter permease, partial [Chloroflexi bacterium]|nr:ABC transporter permease [Chloroflexota bacterium]
MELPPGDYLDYRIQQLESQGHTGARQEIESLRVRYALDRPLAERFFNWIIHFVQGDFGESFQHNKPVRELIGDRLLMTVILSVSSMIITWVGGVLIGVYSATHKYTVADHVFTGLAFLGLGIPNFLLALVFLLIGLQLFGEVPIGLFSAGYENAPWSLARVTDLLKHLWIPALIVATSSTASLMRVMRGNLLDTLGAAYVEVARAKGLRERTVIWKYAVRTAMHPLIMSFGMSLPAIISGSEITGMVLNLPTTGPMYLQALRVQDMYLGGTMLVLISVMLVFGNLIADFLLAILDPRVRYD